MLGLQPQIASVNGSLDIPVLTPGFSKGQDGFFITMLLEILDIASKYQRFGTQFQVKDAVRKILNIRQKNQLDSITIPYTIGKEGSKDA